MVGEITDSDEEIPGWTTAYVVSLLVVVFALLVVHVGGLFSLQVDTTTILLLVLLVLVPSTPRLTSLKFGELEATFAEEVEAAKTDFDATIGSTTPQQVLEQAAFGDATVERGVEDAVSDVEKGVYRRYRYLPGAGLVEVLEALGISLQALLDSESTDLDTLTAELRRRVRNDEFRAAGSTFDVESVDALEEFVTLSEIALENYCSNRVGTAEIKALVDLGLSYVGVLGGLYAVEYNTRRMAPSRDESAALDDPRYDQTYVGSIREAVDRVTTSHVEPRSWSEDSNRGDPEQGGSGEGGDDRRVTDSGNERRADEDRDTSGRG